MCLSRQHNYMLYIICFIGKATTTLSKVAAANLPFPPKHSKLQMAECPIDITAKPLYNSDPFEYGKTDSVASKVSAVIHNSLNIEEVTGIKTCTNLI